MSRRSRPPVGTISKYRSIPFHPVVRLVRARWGGVWREDDKSMSGDDRSALVESQIGDAGKVSHFLGIPHSRATAWVTQDRIPTIEADRLASSLGLHPVDIWPDWYELTAGADD